MDENNNNNNNNKQPEKWPDDDKAIYIPDREYHQFMQSFFKLEQAQKEFHKIRDGMDERIEN